MAIAPVVSFASEAVDAVKFTLPIELPLRIRFMCITPVPEAVDAATYTFNVAEVAATPSMYSTVGAAELSGCTARLDTATHPGSPIYADVRNGVEWIEVDS